MNVSEDGIRAMQHHEGFSLKAYPDPATGGDPWTIGYGHTGSEVRKGVVWTKQECDEVFAQDLQKFAIGVSRSIGESITTQDQFDAMVSLAYNVGLANFRSSTLLKKHKASDYAGAEAQFARWNKAAGKVMKGLTTRRAAEAKMYRGK